jgi:hypothetical protein
MSKDGANLREGMETAGIDEAPAGTDGAGADAAGPEGTAGTVAVAGGAWI